MTEHRYKPRGTAKELFSIRASEVLVSGPAGTGKSRACLEKLFLSCLLNPGMRGLIARKTAVSLSSTALVTWREYVAKEAIAVGDCYFYGGSREEAAQYRFTNGSTVTVGGLDQSTKIMSSEYDMVYVQEATELLEQDWEAITTRLRNGKVSYQQLLADCNPNTPTHWLKRRCDTGKTVMLDSRHEENPRYFDEDGQPTPQGTEYLKVLDALTGVRYQRLRKGQWTSAEGLIFDTFDQAINVVDAFEIPQSWTRWWTIDFGFTNPFVCQWWAEDPDGRLYLYREIYRTQTLVEDHAKAILSYVTDADGKWTEPQPRSIICDHDAEDRATLERHVGLGTTPAHKGVSDGLQAVSVRFRRAGDGKPRLFLLRDARVNLDQALEDSKKPTSTIEEVPGYVWKDSLVKEEPVKVNDHGCDAMRYMVAEADLGVRPRVRWLS